MYLCGPGKHNCQPFCGPEGRFYSSDSVCSLWPAPFSYLCVSVMILCVLKTVCGWTSKNWSLPYACCGLHFIDSAACVLSFDHSTPLHLRFMSFWFNNISVELSFSTWIRVERDGSRARESRTIQWMSECVDVCVCVLDHFLIVRRCHVQVINADMFIT